jgi:hypothetical protein
VARIVSVSGVEKCQASIVSPVQSSYSGQDSFSFSCGKMPSK